MVQTTSIIHFSEAHYVVKQYDNAPFMLSCPICISALLKIPPFSLSFFLCLHSAGDAEGCKLW